MKILSAKFIKSVARISQLPPDKFPEIAFAGRSNVGKSSLINCLIQRKNLAKTSSSPGKTRLINYYSVNDRVYFVDLPGYGYAKVSKEERKQWKRLIESFLTASKDLVGIIQIFDSRIGLTELDIEMLTWIKHLQKPAIIVATKIDKLPKSKANHILNQHRLALKEFGDFEMIPFSAVTKHGAKEIWKAILSLIHEHK